jgi:hypothetical protein
MTFFTSLLRSFWKKKLLTLPVFVLVFSCFGFYFTSFYPQEISLRGYFSSMLSAVEGLGQNKLIRINLYDYSISLYEDGHLVKRAKISAAGHPTRAATPQGSFTILSKEQSHISGLSGLIMPLSLRFFQGYFIHDLPLTKSGKPYNSEYSSGCVRLQGDLAKEVFQWANVGTKVVIYEANLVRNADAPTVYFLTKDGYKHPIANPVVFQSRGFSWRKVVSIPVEEIEQYQNGMSIE